MSISTQSPPSTISFAAAGGTLSSFCQHAHCLSSCREAFQTIHL